MSGVPRPVVGTVTPENPFPTPIPDSAPKQAQSGAGVRKRSRRSARAAGSSFERVVADYLAANLDDRIDRRVKTGAKDCGDIGGIRFAGHRIVAEVKNTAKLDLPAWTREAQQEAVNDGALIGVVVHKRHGVGVPGQQWVTLTLEDLTKLLALG